MNEINWNYYQELQKIPKEKMTSEQWNYYKWMYHIEECQCGLDGDYE